MNTRPQYRISVICDIDEIGKMWLRVLDQGQMRARLVPKVDVINHDFFGRPSDVVLIDDGNMDPDMLTVCRQLRTKLVVPVLLMGSGNKESDVLAAYAAGVDEYLAKPVSPAVLLAKVQAWLRHAWTVPVGALDRITLGNLHLDPLGRQFSNGMGHTYQLTNLEFRLLYLLMNHQGHTLKTDTILERIWGSEAYFDKALLKSLVYRLRKKIEAGVDGPTYIQAVPGVGYRFVLPD